MSTEGGISDWVVARLKAQVAALTGAEAIGKPEEMEIIGRNVPFAGVLIMDGVPGENILMNGTQEVLFDVETYVSSRTFRGGSDLTATDGSYDLWDDIYAALVGETPTGASQPFRFAGSGRLIADDGLVLMMFKTRTMVIKQKT